MRVCRLKVLHGGIHARKDRGGLSASSLQLRLKLGGGAGEEHVKGTLATIDCCAEPAGATSSGRRAFLRVGGSAWSTASRAKLRKALLMGSRQKGQMGRLLLMILVQQSRQTPCPHGSRSMESRSRMS